MSRSSLSTKQRILNAAERLFADHGFAAASLRRVTADAGVNLAAVNYHFGSKETLIEEVFRRRLDELNTNRIKSLERIEGQPSTTLEDVLDAFAGPALTLALDTRGGSAFVRVLARAYADQDDRLRKFLSDNYGHVLKRFAHEFARLLPDLDKETLYWRLDIVAGALTYVMADFGISKRREGVSEAQHRKQAKSYLIDFAAAGMRSA
ncbi:MAG: TetR/AcrR family transcriptional regulator [Rhodanobacteraceae bacterium]